MKTVFSDPQRYVPLYLVEADFPSGMIRFTQSPGNVSWNGHTWLAAGTPYGPLLSVGTLASEASSASRAVEVTLNGLDPTTMFNARNENPIGRRLTVYIGAFDKSQTPWTLVADPFPFYSGLMSVPAIQHVASEENPQQSFMTYTIRCEDETIRQTAVSPKLRTNEHHQADHPGDQYHRFAAELADHEGVSPGPNHTPRELYD